MSLRCVYLDLDGTLLGLRASLFHDGEGNVSMLGARAVEACLRADVEIVLVSGRRQAQVAEDARMLGQRAYVFEAGAGPVGAGGGTGVNGGLGPPRGRAVYEQIEGAGACLVDAGEETWMTGDFDPHGERTIYEQIEASGAPALLLEQFGDRLEYHDPWHRNREVSHLFRGLVDAFEVDELLARRGHDGLRLVDNGVVHRRSEKLASLPQVRAYHLVPIDSSKAQAAGRHRRLRGYAADECIAVGDSREDMGMAKHVGTFWLPRNAVDRDPSLRDGLPANARIAEAGHGEGVYQAIGTTLAEARGAAPA